MSLIYLLHKPYLMLSQFTDNSPPTNGKRRTLAEVIDIPDIYPAGRLDYDSEGLLLLTADGALAHRITAPDHKQPKTYWVQVEGIPEPSALEQLGRGVTLKDGPTRPAKVRMIAPPAIAERDPPVRFRAEIPTQWLEITIIEGRNRQVRRMTAHIGHPTLRLVRTSIGPWTLDSLAPGEWRTTKINMPTRSAGRGQARRNHRR
ncbi:Ribosomal large subunit pseudouridine synthase E [Carnimonas sp. R-84981]|uniref:pseudouridine synthase n=1 Tax=Carnimonas bestiolae TaxID=3402172 RepID=UPI003EDC8C18